MNIDNISVFAVWQHSSFHPWQGSAKLHLRTTKSFYQYCTDYQKWVFLKKRLLTIKYAFIAILFYFLHAHQSLPEKSEVSLFIRKTSCCLFFFNLQFVFCKQEAQSNQFQSGFSALDLNPFMTFAKHVSKFQGEGEEDSWHCNFLWWTNWCITKRHPHTQATRQLTTKSDLNTGLDIAIKKGNND